MFAVSLAFGRRALLHLLHGACAFVLTRSESGRNNGISKVGNFG